MNNNLEISKFLPAFVIGILVIAFLSNDLYLPSMPALVSVFGVSANALQLSITTWFAGSMALQLFLGPLSDAYGRRPVFLFSIVLLIIASLICALSSSYYPFLAGRLLQGFATSGIMVVAFASIHEVYQPLGKGTQMLAYVSMGSAMAPIFGPLIGGVIYAYIGWTANFYAVALGGILLWPLLVKFMPETNQHKKNSINVKQVLSNYGSLLKNLQYTSTVLSYGFLFFAGGVFLTGIAFIYSDIFQIKLEYIGLGISPMLLSYIIAASLAGKLEKKIGADKAIMFVFYVLSIAMIAMLFLSYMQHPLLVYIVAPMIVYYFSLGLIGPMLNHLSLSFAPNESKGAASAMLTFTMMLGSTLGSVLMSLLYDHSLKIFSIIIAVSIAFSFFSYLIFRVYQKKQCMLDKAFDMN